MLRKHGKILFIQVRAYSFGVQGINVEKQETDESGYK